MSLSIQRDGDGPELVMLHGWGLHSAVWDDLVGRLKSSYCCVRVDLPGHGSSPFSDAFNDLGAFCDELNRWLSSPAIWLGWSLGGLIAQAYALRYPQAVKRLLLITSSPRFVQVDNWPQAIRPEVLAMFANNLQQDYTGTLKRFLALQLQGSEHGKTTLRRLREILTAQPPQAAGLRAGLQLLRDTDLRSELPQLACPMRLILGEYDTLAPAAVAADIGKLCPDTNYAIIKGAAHAPFLSHPEQFHDIVLRYLHD